jgi:23S rRNA pseudouridine1911/1915/1917 synthase
VPEPARADDLVLHSRVPPRHHGVRLLDYLCARFPYHDRARWQRELLDGRLRIGDRPATADQRLATGDTIAYAKAHAEPWVDDRIGRLYVDDALLVVDKPAHLPMHADGPFVRNTLIHLLRRDFPEDDLALVHRLDRETSGVCVVPRTAAARAALHAQFERGKVQKAYVAVVRGRFERDLRCESPIGHARGSSVAVRRSAAADALAPKAAATTFTVLERGPHATLVRCEPHTGRTHQIRVHLEAVGHPLLGDRLYGRPDDDYLTFVRSVKASGDPRRATPAGEPDRQLLHAHSLGIEHPLDGSARTFTAPVPAVFAEWLAR